MDSVTEKFIDVLPAWRTTARTGWINYACPACNDKRMRGGFLKTDSGGFRIRCFNGGCSYEEPTGYEPGGSLGGRPLKYYELLGGNVADLPWTDILKQSSEGEKKKDVQDIVTTFPSMPLPEGSILLKEATNYKSKTVLEYLNNRGDFYIDVYPFYWTPMKPYHLIIPWFMGDDIVGWVGRNVTIEKGNKRFWFPSEKPADYLFNQHLLHSRAGSHMFLVTGEMDAIGLNCVASRGDNLTQKQINLLNVSGKEIIVVPDRDTPDYLIKIAKENKWKVSCPEWGQPGKFAIVKDVSEAMKKWGQLFTIELLMDGISDNYLSIELFYESHKRKT